MEDYKDSSTPAPEKETAGGKHSRISVMRIVSSFAAGTAITALACLLRSRSIPPSVPHAQRLFICFCDGTFSAGALLCCAGVLTIASNEGMFNAVTWGFSRFTQRLRSGKQGMPYFDYIQSRKNKKHVTAHLFIAGGAFLAVSLILLLIVNL